MAFMWISAEGEKTAMQQQIESLFHFHLSLHALRLKLTFASKKYQTCTGLHYKWSNSRQSHCQWTHQNFRNGYGWPRSCLTHQDIKRCYFPSQPQLNLSICSGHILIWAAQYTAHHHHEIFSCSPLCAVFLQEADRLPSIMKKVMSVKCFSSLHFSILVKGKFCFLAI